MPISDKAENRKFGDRYFDVCVRVSNSKVVNISCLQHVFVDGFFFWKIANIRFI